MTVDVKMRCPYMKRNGHAWLQCVHYIDHPCPCEVAPVPVFQATYGNLSELRTAESPFLVGDRVRFKQPRGIGTGRGTVTSIGDREFGPGVRFDDDDGVHTHSYPVADIERIPAKAEPPLTVTAERYCPPEQVIALAGEECVHCGHEYGLHYENCITRYHEQLTAFGSEQYERLASDLEQVRVLARASLVESLSPRHSYENMADWAARMRLEPPKPGKYAAWLEMVRDLHSDVLARVLGVPVRHG